MDTWQNCSTKKISVLHEIIEKPILNGRISNTRIPLYQIVNKDTHYCVYCDNYIECNCSED